MTKPLRQRAQPPASVRVPSGDVPWRALSGQDVDGILQLLNLCEEHDRMPYRTDMSEIEELFDSATPHAAYGGLGPSGEIVAYGYVRLKPAEGGVLRAVCSGAVHPEYRAQRLGSEIVEWQLDVARHLLADSDHTGPAEIAHFADEAVDGMVEILERNGFSERRWYTQMRRAFIEPVPESKLGPFLELVPWSAEHSENVRRAHNSAFRDAGIGAEVSDTEWQAQLASLVPEWSFVVLDKSSDRAKIAGYILASKWETDWSALGWTEGWIEAFGVLGPWRRLGVGRSLIIATLNAIKDSGMDGAAMDVDSDAEAGAHDLYEQLGFRPTHRTIQYVIEL